MSDLFYNTLIVSGLQISFMFCGGTSLRPIMNLKGREMSILRGGGVSSYNDECAG